MPSYGQETVLTPAQDGLSLAEKCLIDLSFSTRILTIIPPRIPRLAFRRAYLTAWRGNINSCVTSMRDDIPLCSPISTYLCGVALILCLSVYGCRVFSFLAVILFLCRISFLSICLVLRSLTMQRRTYLGLCQMRFAMAV